MRQVSSDEWQALREQAAHAAQWSQTLRLNARKLESAAMEARLVSAAERATSRDDRTRVDEARDARTNGRRRRAI